MCVEEEAVVVVLAASKEKTKKILGNERYITNIEAGRRKVDKLYFVMRDQFPLFLGIMSYRSTLV